MATTTFVDRQTPILAAWLNDVDDVVYTGYSAPSGLSRTLVERSGEVVYSNDYSSLQAAIDYVNSIGGGVVELPPGTITITVPLVLYSNIELRGKGAEVTIISKVNNMTGTGTSRARSAAYTDSYVVDSIINIWHTDTASGTLYTWRPKITGVTLQGVGNTYGIFAPRMTHAMFTDVQITDVLTGYYTYDAWMCTFNRVVCQAVAYGFRHVDDGSGVGTGTSCHFDNCWVNFDNTVAQPISAFSFYGLTYSALTTCAADNLVRADTTVPYIYEMFTCRGITMMACAAEASAAGFLNLGSGTVSVINARTFNMSCNAGWGTAAGITNDAGTLVVVGGDFSTWTGAGAGFYNLIIQNGAKQTEIDSTMPAGGSSFVSYGSGSTRTILGNAQLATITSSNTFYTVPLTGSAVYDPPNLVDAAGTTTTVTVTGAALGDFVSSISFSLDLQGITVTGYVSSANTVSVRFQNETGGAIDLGSGTLKVRVNQG